MLPMSRSAGAYLVLAALLLSGPAIPGHAQEPDPGVPTDTGPGEPPAEDSLISEEPIVTELAQGLRLLDEQIATQEGLLHTAQTDRERRLIENHIRLLQKERRSFQSLLYKLVGPDFETMAQEAQEEHRERRAGQQEQAAEAAADRAAEKE